LWAMRQHDKSLFACFLSSLRDCHTVFRISAARCHFRLQDLRHRGGRRGRSAGSGPRSVFRATRCTIGACRTTGAVADQPKSPLVPPPQPPLHRHVAVTCGAPSQGLNATRLSTATAPELVFTEVGCLRRHSCWGHRAVPQIPSAGWSCLGQRTSAQRHLSIVINGAFHYGPRQGLKLGLRIARARALTASRSSSGLQRHEDRHDWQAARLVIAGGC